MKIAITGATGFVGKEVALVVAAAGHTAICLTRQVPRGENERQVDYLGADENIVPHLKGVSTVIHLAARVHVMDEHATEALPRYRQANVEVTRKLLRAAKTAGVQRFVFLSTCKVFGEFSPPLTAFGNDHAVNPDGAYAVSKVEAEKSVRGFAGPDRRAIIVRPPLVYGPGVGANFRSLMATVDKGWPLPFGAIDNRRSLVGLTNLAQFLLHCATSDAVASGSYVISDGVDVSTADLIRSIAAAMGKSPRLLPVPVPLLKMLLGFMGKADVMGRLAGDLRLDAAQTFSATGWTPPRGFAEEIARTVKSFRSSAL